MKNRRTQKSNTIVICMAMVTICVIGAFVQNILIKPDQSSESIYELATIDGDRLKAGAKCFAIHEKLSLDLEKILSKLRKVEDEIKSEYIRVKNDAKLNENQKAKENMKIEKKWKEQSSKYADQINEIKELDSKVTKKIQTTLDKIIEKLSKDHKIKLVLNKSNQAGSQIYYSDQDLDITERVIKKLDEELPSVELKEFERDG